MVSYHLLIAVAATSMLVSILALTVALDRFEIRPVTDFETEPLSPDAIYLGAATLIGLATFGSVIGTSIIKGSKGARVKSGVSMIAIGTAGVIGMQGLLMLVACCGEVRTYIVYPLIISTMGFVFIAILGFGRNMDELFKRFSSKSPARE